MSLFIHSVCKGDVRVVCCHHNVTAALLCWLSASLHLAAACSGLQQVSETACSHMHAYPQQREHTHTHTADTHSISLPRSYGHTKIQRGYTFTNDIRRPGVSFPRSGADVC